MYIVLYQNRAWPGGGENSPTKCSTTRKMFHRNVPQRRECSTLCATSVPIEKKSSVGTILVRENNQKKSCARQFFCHSLNYGKQQHQQQDR